MFMIVIISLLLSYCARSTHWAQKYSIYLSNKKKTDKKYLFMFSNIIVIVFDILFHQDINRHIIDLFHFFFED